VIPIALSYRIIKNGYSRENSAMQLETVDIKEFQKDMDSSEYEAEAREQEDPSMVSAKELRQKIHEEMRVEREALLSEAMERLQAEMEEARSQAVRRGHEEGFQKGQEDALKETELLRSQALEMFREAEKATKAYLDENEENILRLSSRIAEKIVQVTLDSHEENIMLLARPVLQEYGKTENVILSCHPRKTELLRNHLPEIEKMCPNAHILILQDKNLSENDLIIENESQITDLTIRKQIRRFLELALD
jgi:flagellar assembly protein FliH